MSNQNKKKSSLFDYLKQNGVTISAVLLLLCTFVFLFELHDYMQVKKSYPLNPSEDTTKKIIWHEHENPSELNSMESVTPSVTLASKVDMAQNSAEAKKTTDAEEYFVLNTQSKKIHKSTCRYVKNMKEENKKRIDASEIDALKRENYSFCGVCF